MSFLTFIKDYQTQLTTNRNIAATVKDMVETLDYWGHILWLKTRILTKPLVGNTKTWKPLWASSRTGKRIQTAMATPYYTFLNKISSHVQGRKP
jgi:hypothetical protein